MVTPSLTSVTSASAGIVVTGAPVEASVFDPSNPHVMGPHLCAAAQESPLTEADLPLFGPRAREVLEELTTLGLLRRRPRGWFWTDSSRAADLADIRSAGVSPVQLIEADTGRVVGSVDAGGAHQQAHPGAVYVHQGETWLVEDLDLEHHVATMRRDEPSYSTTAREVTDISIVETRERRSWGGCELSLGEVDVSHQVVSFLKRRQPGGECAAKPDHEEQRVVDPERDREHHREVHRPDGHVEELSKDE